MHDDVTRLCRRQLDRRRGQAINQERKRHHQPRQWTGHANVKKLLAVLDGRAELNDRPQRAHQAQNGHGDKVGQCHGGPIVAGGKIVTKLVRAQDEQQRKSKGRAREQIAAFIRTAGPERAQDRRQKQRQVDPGPRWFGAHDTGHGDQYVLLAVPHQHWRVLQQFKTAGQFVKGYLRVLLQVAAKADRLPRGHVHGGDAKNTRQLRL